MTTATGISSKERFSKNGEHCPICGGYNSQERGNGERCYGFYSADKKYATCVRDEYAGNLERTDAGYTHRLEGECKCGKSHGIKNTPALAARKMSSQPTTKSSKDFFPYDDARAVAKYHYRDENGKNSECFVG